LGEEWGSKDVRGFVEKLNSDWRWWEEGGQKGRIEKGKTERGREEFGRSHEDRGEARMKGGEEKERGGRRRK